MAKKGMSRPEQTHAQPRNDQPPVPELQGKEKCSKDHAKPIVPGTGGPDLKVFHR